MNKNKPLIKYLILFLILQTIAYLIGFQIKWEALCETCPAPPAYYPPCP